MITQYEFAMWKKDPVTVKILEELGENIKNIEDTILSDDFIDHPQVQVRLARLAGKREVLQFITNLTSSDFPNEEGNNER